MKFQDSILMLNGRADGCTDTRKNGHPPHHPALYLGLHCLSKYPFRGFEDTNG